MAEQNPYVGPRPFTEEEDRFFFGRAEEVEILTSLAVARRASLLFAQSGAGKSSLLRAGLTPRLLRHTRMVRGRETVQSLVSDNTAQSHHGVDGRFFDFRSRILKCNGNQAFAGERVGSHLTVPGLEDVQRYCNIWKQHQIRKRE